MNWIASLAEDLPKLKKDWPTLSDFWKEATIGQISLQVDRCDQVMKLTTESVLGIFSKSNLENDHELTKGVLTRLKLWGSIK